MFKRYTGWQWLLIDAATNFGLDKLRFEERIEWTEQNLNNLETLVDQAETKPLYFKAVGAIRRAQAGVPIGHMVGVDATCSGIQIMSVMTGCVDGARATGLIDPDRRADAYTQTTNEMKDILGTAVDVSRGDAKKALMTSFYGSKAQPKHIFGEGTKELEAFYQAALRVAPGAWQLLQDLLASWQPNALMHDWKLPDGFDARVKVMSKKKVRIEVDELNKTEFTYEYYDNEGQEKGLSNVANLTHSMDAYVLREMHRRCNYDRDLMEHVAALIQIEMMKRKLSSVEWIPAQPTGKVRYYVEQYERSTLASAVILPHINEDSVTTLTSEHLDALSRIVNGMLSYKSFPLVTVHDEFKAHPNNVNQVRWHYKEILADIAESDVLDDLLTQINKAPGTFHKLSFNLPDQIRQSNYGLC
jgi:hypothetical protein